MNRKRLENVQEIIAGAVMGSGLSASLVFFLIFGSELITMVPALAAVILCAAAMRMTEKLYEKKKEKKH